MVVVPTVLVVNEDEHRARPLRRRADGMHHLGQDALADSDVLRVFLRLGPEVGIEQREGRELAGRRV